jgi:tetratricopeptide (TPR) repeat protein
MLLKAQTMGIPVRRHGDGEEGGFARRYVIRPFQRYRVPLTILAVALAVFAGVILIALYLQPRSTSTTVTPPPELKNVLTRSQQSAFDAMTALATLQNHPEHPESLRTLAAFYYDQYTNLSASDPATALDAAQQAIRYSERYLAVSPSDNDARVDAAVLYFYTGQADKAIQLVSEVLKVDKGHVKGNYNLGIFLWQSARRDYPGAAAQFEKVIALTANDPHNQDIFQGAKTSLAQLRKDAAAAGRPLPSTNASATPTSGVTVQ